MRDSLKKKKKIGVMRLTFPSPMLSWPHKLSTGKLNSRPFHVCMYSSLMTICKRDLKKVFWKSKEKQQKPNVGETLAMTYDLL